MTTRRDFLKKAAVAPIVGTLPVSLLSVEGKEEHANGA